MFIPLPEVLKFAFEFTSEALLDCKSVEIKIKLIAPGQSIRVLPIRQNNLLMFTLGFSCILCTLFLPNLIHKFNEQLNQVWHYF